MVVVLLLGCQTGALGGLVATADPRIPTTIDVAWDLLSPAGTTWVEYGRDPETLDRRTPDGVGPSATILGLSGGETWSLRAVTVDAAGERWQSDLVEVAVAAPPASLPRFSVGEAAEDRIDPGLVVFTTLLMDGEGWIVGLDRDGDYVWWWASEDGVDVPSIHLDAAGDGLVFLDQGKWGDPQNGILDLSFHGDRLEHTLAPDGHHDAIQLPDGRLAWLRGEVRDAVELDSGESLTLAYDTVAETGPGSITATADVRFSVLDDLDYRPWRMCKHFDDTGPGGGSDYTHANSLMYDSDTDAFWLMSKNLDALLSVDRGSGAVNWQAGGRYSSLVDVAGDPAPADAEAVDGPNATWWSHGHMSDAWGDGFLVFDNGYHHATRESRVVEYTLDPAAGTVQKVWEYPAEEGAFNPLLGDAVRLADGDTLISWGLSGELTEVTPEGEVVWRATVDLGAAVGRIVAMPELAARGS